MKKTKRAAAALLAACLLLCLGGCGSGVAENARNGIVVTTSLEGKPVLVGNIPGEYPLTTGDESLDVLICTSQPVAPKDVFVWQKYAEMTGVDVNWTSVARDDRSEKVNTVLSNKQSCDLILRCKVSANRLTQYGESGLILDLAKDGMLEKYAPNCWAYLQSHPVTLASVTNPDGAIYSLPQVNSGAELRVALKLYVNKSWLANTGTEIPKTTEEFYTLLKAFKDGDPNGNGDTTDEIPFSCPIWNAVTQSMQGAFGLMNRGLHNEVVDCDEATGDVRLTAGSEGYRSMLTYLNRLYSEGLLDKYAFTASEEQWDDGIANDKIGVFASTNLASLPADKADNWVAIGEALEGPSGDKLWAPIRADFHSTGAAVIPANCKDPELVLKWLDYFWTDEGTLFYHMGIEGETFEVKEDGTYDYLPSVYEQMKTENKKFDEEISEISPYPGGSNPTVEIAPYFMGGEMAEVPAAAARTLINYGPKEYWPSFTFTAEENDALDAVRTDLEKYIDTMTQSFVTGEKPLTAWDTYTAQLQKLGADKLVAIYQAAVDRYNSAQAAQ